VPSDISLEPAQHGARGVASARYRVGDFTGPLDVKHRLRQLPSNGTVKGMFFRRVIADAQRRAGVTLRDHPYHAFRDYRLSDWIDLLVTAGALTYPGAPPKEGLRRLGRDMYPTFVDSMLGKVIFAAAGGDLHRALVLYPKIWSVISNHGTGAVTEMSVGRCVIQLRNVWDFVDSFQLGSLEGGFAVFGRRATVHIETLSDCDANYEVQW